MSVSKTDRFELTTTIEGVGPERLYDAWIDGPKHAAMTGAGAESTPEIGGRFTAWDGYIRGRHLALERPRRIVQAWRTAEFPKDAPDSRVELRLEAAGTGTRVVLVHSEIPAGQGSRYEAGWVEHYFDPMRAHFAEPR